MVVEGLVVCGGCVGVAKGLRGGTAAGYFFFGILDVVTGDEDCCEREEAEEEGREGFHLIVLGGYSRSRFMMIFSDDI